MRPEAHYHIMLVGELLLLLRNCQTPLAAETQLYLIYARIYHLLGQGVCRNKIG